MDEMRRNPPARWVLPTVVDPPDKLCIEIHVPNDAAHIAAFRGAMLSLASAYNWADDPTHKAKEVALVWRDIIDDMVEWGCTLQTQIREDAICQLSWSYDDWVTFDTYDPSACITALIDSVVPGLITQAITDAIEDGTIQGGTGQQSPQSAPAPGECRTYHVRLGANDKWHCPSPIQAGDTVHITNPEGGWNDGDVGWYCPDGRDYLLGLCVGGLRHETGDPLNPGAYHMALIGLFDTTYFDPLTAVYTVPNGTAETELFIQANDGTLSDNMGEVTFDVEVCTGTWCYRFDFTTGQDGWTIPSFSSPHAVYSAGNGFEHNAAVCRARITIDRAFTSAALLSIEVIRTGGTSNIGVWIQGTDGTNLGNTGYGAPLDSTISLNVTRANLRIDVRGTGDCNGTTVEGYITTVILRGTGTNPFGASNC